MTTTSIGSVQTSPRRLLVTGGAGFIGSNFVHHWVKLYPSDHLVVLDALTYAGNLENLAGLDQQANFRPNFRFVQGDICDRPLVEELLHSEAIDTLPFRRRVPCRSLDLGARGLHSHQYSGYFYPARSLPGLLAGE